MAILSNDPLAIEKLQKKIEDLEKQRKRNNKINKLVRNDDVEGLAKMGFSNAEIEKLMTGDFMGRKGIPAYVNQNISGNIRSAKERIAMIEKRQEIVKSGPSEIELDSIRIEFDEEEDRLRLHFDHIPDPEVRSAIKSRGFRWSPRNKAWQRQITDAARKSMEYFLQDQYPEEYKLYLEKKDAPAEKPEKKVNTWENFSENIMQMIEDRMSTTHDEAYNIVQKNVDILREIYDSNPDIEVEKGYAAFKEKIDQMEAESRAAWEKEVKDYIQLQAKVDEDTAAQLMAENTKILDQARKEGTNELFTAEKLIDKMPPPVEEVAEDSTDLWRLGTNIFQEHKEKVLGTPYAGTGLRGPITLYEGDINDLDKINVPMDWLDQQDPDSLLVSQEHVEIETDPDTEQEIVLTSEETENIDRAIATAESDIAKEFLKKAEARKASAKSGMDFILLSFNDILEDPRYNGSISPDELKVFIWYKWYIGQGLSGKWLEIYNPETDHTDQQTEEWIKKGLVCFLDGDLMPAYLYFAENVYERQDQLENDREIIIQKYGQDVFDAQSARLGEMYQKLVDNRLRISEDLENPMRLVIKPISDFAYDYFITTLADEKPFMVRASERKDDYGQPDFLKTENYSDSQKATYKSLPLIDAFIYWMQENKNTIRFKRGMNWRMIYTIYLKAGRRPADTDETVWQRQKSIARSEGDRLFNQFLATGIKDSDREAIEIFWNKQYNSYVPIDYNKVPIAFEVSAFYQNKPMEIRSEKRDAIAFGFNEGSACDAYGVGVGKTWAGVFQYAQFMYAGYCKRPFVVVPNQTYKQWISELGEILPHIPINDLYNLSKEYIDKLKNDKGEIMPVPENSISVMTYDGFANLGFNENTRQDLVSQLATILEQGDPMAMSARKVSSFQERLEELVGKGIEGTMVNIEDLGFDYACWDEAHAMKKVFTSVKSTTKGDDQTKFKNYEISSGQPSATALRGFMISQYILRNNNERNVLLLTATPFTNSPLEVFSILSIIAYNKLRETNLNNLNRFFDTYVHVETELVISAGLNPVRKQIFKGFDNLKSLQKLIFRFIDYRIAKNLKRPDLYVLPYKGRMIDGEYVPANEDEQVNTILPMTNQQKAWMEDIRAYAEGSLDLKAICTYDLPDEDEEPDGIEAATPYAQVNPDMLEADEKSGARILMAVNMARNLVLSPYLYQCSNLPRPNYKEYIESSPKLQYTMGCIDTVKKYHAAEGTPMSGQIIYMDLGVDLFPLVKEYLVKKLGFKPHEVGIISAKMKRPKGVSKENAKQNIQNQFLGQKFNEKTLEFDPIPDKDRIKVLIGSPSIREGMNLQRYTTVLYNLTIPWNPTDLVQLYGRHHRQGNLFAAVRAVNPLLENSIDAFIFQKLEEKTARINAIFNRDGKTNFFRTEEFSPGELKKELIRDPRSLAQMIIEEEKEQIQEEKSEFENNIKIAQDIIDTMNMIERAKSWTIDKVESYLPKTPGTERSLNTYITLSEKLMREQKDKDGNPINYDHAFRFLDLRAGVRKLERQRKVFLEPRGIPEDPKALEAYIEAEKKNLDGFNERIQEIESSENIDRIAQQIEKDREAAKYKPASVPERIAEFAKLNYLLSDKRIDDVKKPSKKAPDKKKDTDLKKAKEKARARARARIRILELEEKKPKKKKGKPKFEDLPKALQNEYMTAGIDMEQKSITGGDRTDLNNLPRFYNNTWRSHKKAWTALVNAFHPEMKMYDAMEVLRENGIRVRSYLSMD